MGCFHSIDAVMNPYNHDPTEEDLPGAGGGQVEPEPISTAKDQSSANTGDGTPVMAQPL